jgi:anion-transporting  ArsA/GET3 family ATPase
VILERLLAKRRVAVCAGAGGVGKTTVAAAIGAGMAARGRRVLVLTIDPARRLAAALGLPEHGDEEHRVDERLHASMLDTRLTFDRLVREQAPDPEAAARILENPIYRQLSTAVAGSHEYMAMERLYELHTRGDYDLIVLDTPPARNAVEFLEAPGRVTRFVEGKALRFLLRPGARAGRIGLGAVERLTGTAVVRDMAEFAAAFDGMYDGFARRAEEVAALLRSRQTTFLLVTVPREEPMADADFFWRELRERELPFGGVIVNKVHPGYVGGAPSARTRLRSRARRALAEAGARPETAARAAENLLHYQALADRDRRNVDWLAGRMGRSPLVEVPLLDHDVHDLDGVAAVGRHLFAPPA